MFISRMGQTHKKNKYGSVKELRSTFSHIKSIYLDFRLVWFECGLVSSYVGWMGQNKADVTNTQKKIHDDMLSCCATKNNLLPVLFSFLVVQQLTEEYFRQRILGKVVCYDKIDALFGVRLVSPLQ